MTSPTFVIAREHPAQEALGRYGTEEEIAAAVCFLCSSEASYINGHTLSVDGGFDAAGIGLASLRNRSA